MADISKVELKFRKLPNNPNMFEFTIATPMLKTQFLMPRAVVNQLRVDLERALTHITR